MEHRTSENSLFQLSKKYEQERYDEASSTVTYVGFSEAGAATSDAKWIIKKIEAASASSPQGEISIKWAVAYGNNKQIWDNRASLTYVS